MSKAIPAIVVVAYNRPDSLDRLLNSIAQANYPNYLRIPLVISIDGGGSEGTTVRHIAYEFDWQYGEKEIVDHQTNLGLIEHVFSCGDLSQRFGRIILLEDDLFVGKAYFNYAVQALDFYENDPNIAGISLSALWFHGFTQLPFTPYPDGGDSFFMQIAWYQGQAYTADQWRKFRVWLQNECGDCRDERSSEKHGQRRKKTAPDPYIHCMPKPEDNMHPMFSKFPSTDWFPLKTRYLAHTGRFYAFPRESLAVNFGEMGTHFAKSTSFFQAPLQEQKERWHFQLLDDSVAVYDSWQEMLPDRLKRLVPALSCFEFETDFYGEKDSGQTSADFLLTTQLSSQDERSWGLVMRPPEANLVHDVQGDGVRLARPEHVLSNWRAKLATDWRKYAYFSRYRPTGRMQRLCLWLGRALSKKRTL